MGDDIGMADSLPVHKSGRHADKGLAASGHGGPCHIVQLASRAGDLSQAHALRTDLAVEVHGNTGIDGDHVVDPGNGLRIVDIFQRLYDHAGISVHPVVKAFGAENKACDPLSPLEGLSGIGQLAGLVKLIVGVAAELRMHAQVL